MSQLSWAPGRPSRETSYADRHEMSPPIGGCDNYAKLSPLSWAPGRPSMETFCTDHHETFAKLLLLP
eukprot:7651091-Pyramimonas_sp.AAC.1